jgi:aminoglycoside phosphotransferase (APT) family kinase protein
MGHAQKQDVVSSIGSYLRQLRGLPIDIPNCPGPIDCSFTWTGRWFTDYEIGPLDSYDALVNWLNHKRAVVGRFARQPKHGTPLFTSRHPLVFTHGDIAPRNFIVDNERKLWLIDWERAGWYPAYMEYATIAVELDEHFPIVGFVEWKNDVLGVLDAYKEELSFLTSIGWALMFAPMA